MRPKCVYYISNKKLNTDLSRATEGTGPVMSGNLPHGKVPIPAGNTER